MSGHAALLSWARLLLISSVDQSCRAPTRYHCRGAGSHSVSPAHPVGMWSNKELANMSRVLLAFPGIDACLALPGINA